MPIEPIDTLLALKTLSLAPDLKTNDRRVGAVLLEHYNRRTSRCDPGLERIAELLAISTRTVIRSIHRLEAAGFFRKTRHGGRFNHNSYEPVWSCFQDIEAAWSTRLKGNAQSRAPEVSPASRHPCHLGGDSAVTQTYSSNLLKETCLKRQPRKERGEGLPARLNLSTGKEGTRPADAARTAAERRWTNALHEQFGSMPVTYGEILQAIDPVMQDAATDAEMRKPDAGIAYILQQLRIPNMVSAAKPCRRDGDHQSGSLGTDTIP